jgi:hypothetical protein
VIRYSAAACQTDLPNPVNRAQMRANTDRMLSLVDSAVAGSAPFLPVRWSCSRNSPTPRRYSNGAGALSKLTVPIPTEHTERLTEKAREHSLYIRAARCRRGSPMAGRRVQHHVSLAPAASRPNTVR